MNISKLIIQNFRCFDNNEHVIILQPGLNVFVGENKFI